MEWRSIASPQAQDDVDKLFGDAIKFVAVELAHADDFAPFMMVISLAGEISVRRSAIATTPRDEVGVVRGLELPGDGDQLRARAAVLDVTALVPVAGDAIKIKIEHAEGIAIDMLVPYRIDSDGATINVQAANAARAELLLWTPELPDED
ncbi:Uncharacterised protein [Mycobacteroides abscessus]|uniref:Uncharacterized protein n=2 Tax=Mycobacteroides abscessus TaxID=36809 RepID=A0A829MBX9_9MYCO|nr:hypothetical protein [Mycobacteroides abscessus]ESV57321.1 hypothetical protein L830_3152 [Mycobacteroides abscessus MAB_082312_2258]ESV65699.1 hypothetical protein L833_3092 [Mycobacteroides abscessus MAB_091912_2446]AIC71189.1 hypothetical protein MYCMA_03940 [Mycobacteroides abscessus subsp. massiliense str. GO 06]AMU28148.1 hypothetical protein A3N96_24325 [Mycobacteroides abscessus]AMU37776.1 hypothetical protein A3N98_23205 [Mycobacteroides abscessus]